MAECRLKEIFDYYSEVANRQTANKIIDKIRTDVDLLGVMPYMAAIEPSFDEGQPETLRSLVIEKYKAVYFIENETIYVTDIWDCRQSPVTLKERVTDFFKR